MRAAGARRRGRADDHARVHAVRRRLRGRDRRGGHHRGSSRPSDAPQIQDVFRRYPHIGNVLPAVGYSPQQLDALRATIERADADVVVAATPVDLARLLAIDTPIVHARYEFADGARRVWRTWSTPGRNERSTRHGGDDMAARKKATVAVKRGTMMLQSEARRRAEAHVAPPRQAERRHAKPGAGIKKARNVMSKKSH